RFGYAGMGVDPFFHLDAWVAAQQRSIDLSDYEAITGLFPVVYKKTVNPALQSTLWAMEGPEEISGKVMEWLNANFPARIRYVVVVGDISSPEAQKMGMPRMLAYLDSGMCRVG